MSLFGIEYTYGLTLLKRPGPYINAEVSGGGYPGPLLEGYQRNGS